MASGGRIKRIARRVDEWVSQTAASTSRFLNVPSPVSFPDEDECEEERERADSNESPDDDASGRRSPEYGTGGFKDNVTISDEHEEEIEEQEDEIVEQQEEEEECSDDEDNSEVSGTELEIAGGGYHGFKDSRKQYSWKPSPSSASNASTGSWKRLPWELLKSIDLRKGKLKYEEEIENAMKMQMSICGKMKMVTCSGEHIQGKQTLAGWKLHRVCF